MIGYLERAIEFELTSGWRTLARYDEGSYQGSARIAAVSADGTLFAEGAISWGSCSYCDPWHDMSEKEIMIDVLRSVDTFSREEFTVYLTNIAQLDKELSWWDNDAKWAREALIAMEAM